MTKSVLKSIGINRLIEPVTERKKIKCYYLYLLINPKILSPLIATGFSKEGFKKISTRPRANAPQKKTSQKYY